MPTKALGLALHAKYVVHKLHSGRVLELFKAKLEERHWPLLEKSLKAVKHDVYPFTDAIENPPKPTFDYTKLECHRRSRLPGIGSQGMELTEAHWQDEIQRKIQLYVVYESRGKQTRRIGPFTALVRRRSPIHGVSSTRRYLDKNMELQTIDVGFWDLVDPVGTYEGLEVLLNENAENFAKMMGPGYYNIVQMLKVYPGIIQTQWVKDFLMYELKAALLLGSLGTTDDILGIPRIPEDANTPLAGFCGVSRLITGKLNELMQSELAQSAAKIFSSNHLGSLLGESASRDKLTEEASWTFLISHGALIFESVMDRCRRAVENEEEILDLFLEAVNIFDRHSTAFTYRISASLTSYNGAKSNLASLQGFIRYVEIEEAKEHSDPLVEALSKVPSDLWFRITEHIHKIPSDLEGSIPLLA